MAKNTLQMFIDDNLPVFAINIMVIKKLESMTETIHYHKNEVLFAEGKVVGTILLIEEGSLMSYQNNDSLEKVNRFWFKKEIIFLADSIFNHVPIQHSIIALNDSTLSSISINAMLNLAKENPSIWELINLFHKLEHQSISRVVELLNLPPANRYQSFMKQRPELIQLIKASLIANYLNMGYSSFCRFRQSRI